MQPDGAGRGARPRSLGPSTIVQPIETIEGRSRIRGRLLSFLPALLITLSSAVIAASASLAAPPTGKVGVVFSPGLSGEDAQRRVVMAGGLPVSAGAFDNIVIAWAETADFQSNIREEGAWLIFDPQGLGGCLRPIL